MMYLKFIMSTPLYITYFLLFIVFALKAQFDVTQLTAAGINPTCPTNGLINVVVPGGTKCSAFTAQLFKVGFPWICGSTVLPANSSFQFTNLPVGDYSIVFSIDVVSSSTVLIGLTSTYLSPVLFLSGFPTSCEIGDEFYTENRFINVDFGATGLEPFSVSGASTSYINTQVMEMNFQKEHTITY